MKKLLAALLAMTICLSFAACGDSDDGKSDTKSKTEASETEKEKEEEKKDEDKEEEKKDEEKEEEKKEEEKKDDEKKDEEKKEEKKDDDKKDSNLSVAYSNDAYSIYFDTEKWVDANAFKDIVAQAAADNTAALDAAQVGEMLDGMFFYADEADSEYPTNILFMSPIYDATMASLKITDEGIADLMITSLQSQMEAQEGMSVTNHDIVKRGGEDWLLLQVHAELGEGTYNCDEYVTFHNGYSLIISVNYLDANDPAKADFERMLDEIEFKV